LERPLHSLLPAPGSPLSASSSRSLFFPFKTNFLPLSFPCSHQFSDKAAARGVERILPFLLPPFRGNTPFPPQGTWTAP
jgi:hypothetical protein